MTHPLGSQLMSSLTVVFSVLFSAALTVSGCEGRRCPLLLHGGELWAQVAEPQVHTSGATTGPGMSAEPVMGCSLEESIQAGTVHFPSQDLLLFGSGMPH